MRRIRAWCVRLRGVFGKDGADRAMAEELESHIQMHTDDLVRSGLPAAEARRRALIKLGGLAVTNENCHDRRGLPWAESLMQDVAYGFRMFRRNPGFTATVVITLALGIGATTAIFTVVNGVLLRPLPYPEPERLVSVTMRLGDIAVPFTYTRDYAEWSRHNRTLSAIGAYMSFAANLAAPGEPERVTCGLATESLFRLLNVRPVLGRNFLPDEDRPGGPPVAILEHAFWRRRFNASPAAIGKTVALDDKSYTVVGVLPAGFRIPDQYTAAYDLWVPFAISNTGRAREILLRTVGRLKPGVSMGSVRGELDGLMREQVRRNKTLLVLPWHEAVVAGARRSLVLFLGAVGFVLLIVCVNVANLLLSRGAGRGKEIAVRRSMGAGRGRIVRQLLTEAVLMSAAGGMLGLALASVCKGVLLRLIAPRLPALEPIGLDLRVLLFSIAVVLLTGIGFDLAPALQAARVDLNDSLKEGGRGSTEGRRSHRARNARAVVEVALAIVLLCGAGLLFRSFLRLRGVAPGFRPDRVLSFAINLTPARYPNPLDQARFLERLLERLKSVPGVESVAGGSCLPLSGNAATYTGLRLEGHPGETFDIFVARVSPDYFRTMGIPLTAGRTFNDGDREGGPAAVIVSQTFVRRFLPHENPLGRRMTDPQVKNGWPTIEGVVGDVRPEPQGEPKPEIYLPYLKAEPRIVWAGGSVPMTIIVRSAVDPLLLVPAIREQIFALDSTQPPHHFATLDDLRARGMAPRRVNMLLIAAFAALALVLAGIGIYSVLAYSVGQRTHEIGVRIALGARRGQIVGMVLGRGLALIGAGVGIGLVASVALTRLLASELWGVSATDPWTFGAVGVVLGATGVAACLVPARRATKIEPTLALRYE